MLTPDKIDTTQMEFTTEELQTMGEILLKAEEIKADKQLYDLVQKSMKKKAKAITSTEDLRVKANMKAMEE